MLSWRNASGRRPFISSSRLLVLAFLTLGPAGLAPAAFGSGESVSLTSFDLPPGGSVTITFEVDVDSP
ncbi:MAG: hypothetical protein KDD11_16270, partial [Acidobacteria bacterium]|nr:hypothetical protein [Acidobacteriota bacterium]